MKKILSILAGNTLYAAAVSLFILPGGLITGGTTGLALMANHALGIPVALFIGVFNLAMFLLGAFFLGRTFSLTTILSTFYYPVSLGILQSLWQGRVLTDDPLLAAIFAGLLIGAGIGLVIRSGASTGGMDIPPLILNKKYGLPISMTMTLFDGLILISQAVFFPVEQVLYGVLLVFIYTAVLDKVLLLGRSQVQVQIISSCYEEISRSILSIMDRGVTLYAVEGGRFRSPSRSVLTVLPARELRKLNDLVLEIDRDAFLIISQVSEVRGRGFTLRREYR